MDKTEYDMMMRFLQRNYPVFRMKDKKRFKRAIVSDNGVTYFLSDEQSHIHLKNYLIQVIKTVFYCDEKSSRTVLKEYLNI